MNRTYNVTITGSTPLLMHWDNIEWADEMDAWKSSPNNKKVSKAGDDRTPAWRWIGSVYNDGARVVIPSDNLSRCWMEGGAMVPVPGGRMGKTYKAQSQSGMMSAEPTWPLLVGGETVAYADVEAARELGSFPENMALAKRLGFELFVKRARIGQSKHIRVRPRFNKWSAVGSILVWDDQITTAALADILNCAGQYKGLGDWRPGSKTPGPWGMFTAEVSEA